MRLPCPRSRRRPRRVFRSVFELAAAAAAVGVLLLSSAPLAAANLQISPVTIAFQPAQAAAGINLQNLGDAPLYGQVRVYAWDQKDGADVLTPTSEVVASPPIIEIAARATQTIRLVRRGAPDGAGERSYRILIDEIPRGDPAAAGVAIRLQYSVPVFVPPVQPGAAPAMTWTVVKRGAGLVVRATNEGAMHAQIGATRLRTSGGKEIELSKGLYGYALAGRTREWLLPAEKADALSGAVSIVTTVNAREVSAAVAVQGQ